MALGKQIKKYREQLGWTLEVLSEKSGVEVGTISAMENRDSQRSKYAQALAKALGLTLDELLDESITCTSRQAGGHQTEPSAGAGEANALTLTPDMVLELVKNALAAKGPQGAALHHIDHAWPFSRLTREDWLDLTREQQELVEHMAGQLLMAARASGGSGGQHDKRAAA